MNWEKVMMRCLRLLMLIGYLGMELYVFVDWLLKGHHTNLLPWCLLYVGVNVAVFMLVYQFINEEAL